MEALLYLSLICFSIATFCLIALAVIHLATESTMWHRDAERRRKWGNG